MMSIPYSPGKCQTGETRLVTLVVAQLYVGIAAASCRRQDVGEAVQQQGDRFGAGDAIDRNAPIGLRTFPLAKRRLVGKPDQHDLVGRPFALECRGASSATSSRPLKGRITSKNCAW